MVMWAPYAAGVTRRSGRQARSLALAMDPDPTPTPPATASQDRVLTVPQGTFVLRVHPERPRLQVRAWDAADEYVLDHVHLAVPDAARVLVVGDRAGAVTVPLAAAGATVTAVGDSVLAQEALRLNLAANGVTAPVQQLPSTTDALEGPVDLVVVKVPRSLAMLEDQLRRIRPALGPDTVVLGAGMTRHIHTSTLDVFAAVLGPTTTSLARRKARLIHCVPDPDLDPGPSPFPTRYELQDGATVVSHADVFSQGRVDAGTRLLLDNLPDTSAMTTAVDLGCGDGVVGLRLAQANPGLQLVFLDESHMAIGSARATMAANLPGREDTYLLGDGMDPVADASVDLVVVNPPLPTTTPWATRSPGTCSPVRVGHCARVGRCWWSATAIWPTTPSWPACSGAAGRSPATRGSSC